MANLYFLEETAAESFVVDAVVELTGEEARHAVRVSRLRVGETTLVGDGRGTLAQGTVESAERDRCAIRITEVIAHPSSPEASVNTTTPQLVLVQALAKGDRDERAVEQATEFGVDAVTPWESERSVSRWSGKGDDKSAKGLEKWRRIAREASKQSLRPVIPTVREPAVMRDIATAAAREDVTVIALHPRGGRRLTEWLTGEAGRAALTASREVWLVVGPEGGFSDDELDAIERAGGHLLVLGTTVLRTSSAGPAALAVLNATLGRW